MKQLRRERGWSQEELGHEADLDRTYISQVERVVKSPTISSVAKISRAFGCKMGDLLDE